MPERFCKERGCIIRIQIFFKVKWWDGIGFNHLFLIFPEYIFLKPT